MKKLASTQASTQWATRLGDQASVRYAANQSWMNVTLSQIAEQCATTSPDRVAVIDGLHELTFRQVWQKAQALAGALKRRGIERGDVISFQLPNWHEAMVVNLAASIGGFVCNPIIPIYRDSEVSFILKDAATRVIFVPGVFRSINYLEMIERIKHDLPCLEMVFLVREIHENYETLDDLISESQSQNIFVKSEGNDIKLLMYTSGTTGNPKGVIHTHNTLWAEIIAVRDYWQICELDRIFMPSPVTHITGFLYALELPFASKIAAVLMDIWDPFKAVRQIEKFGVTFTVGATPFLVELARAANESGTQLEKLRLFACGGAPVAPELIIDAMQSLKSCRAARIYGSTEAPTITAGTLPSDDPLLGATTDGRILNTEVLIVDLQDVPVAEGQEGEICVRGPEIMVGYTDPTATAEAFTSDGFFRTGDLGFISHEGFITISGRKKDLIIRGGENLSPKEIEDCLMTHAEIQEASVVAAPHPRLGETVMAFLIAKGRTQLSIADIAQHLERCGLARQKFPEIIKYVDSLPRTASGKIRKDVLRKQLNNSKI